MLVVHFRSTFRQRMPEWFAAGTLALLGAILLQPHHVFSEPCFIPLARIATEAVWGWAALMIGAMRLMALIINGAWRATPVLRQIGCTFGIVVWVGMAVGSISAGFIATDFAYLLFLFMIDTASLSFAAQDGVHARLRDRDARLKNV